MDYDTPATTSLAPLTDEATIDWSSDAPRGGRAVLGRIMKEKATVPLFFAQTLVQSLRDVGYDHTTSALCEHVDNAIQAAAKEVRVYFRQTGNRGAYKIDVAVFDNGRGMSPNVLKVATSFGGSLNFNNRQGIGRFGMGMKTAALSMSPVLEIYSWQEPRAFYNMTLDVDAIGRGEGEHGRASRSRAFGSAAFGNRRPFSQADVLPFEPGRAATAVRR